VKIEEIRARLNGFKSLAFIQGHKYLKDVKGFIIQGRIKTLIFNRYLIFWTRNGAVVAGAIQFRFGTTRLSGEFGTW
jgi:hypothetical protein